MQQVGEGAESMGGSIREAAMTEQQAEREAWHQANSNRIIGLAELGWRNVRISEVKDLMKRHGLTIADIQESLDNSSMVNIARTQTPHQPSGNTLAGE